MGEPDAEKLGGLNSHLGQRWLPKSFAPLRGANTRVARLRQAARQARTALRREPVVRPDFCPVNRAARAHC